MGLTHCYKTTVFLHLLRVCTIVQYAVLEATTRVYGKTKNSTPSKYKMAEYIQMPPRIYDNVV